ncbi:MAG: hypothetical protein HOI46_15345 [Rhodospirillaceae bacterium]|jgi:hypothetical protein|nr:hypothetical protein [Rhodospirillaceae bacterium]
MPRSTPPRANWRYFTSAEFISYSPDVEDEIVLALQSVPEGSFNEDDRAELLARASDCAWSYQAAVHLRNGPRRNEVIASLENIAAAATNLSKCLREIDDMSLAALMIRGGHVSKSLNEARVNGLSREEAIESLLGIVPSIGDEAGAALERANNPSPISAEEFIATPAGATTDPRSVLTDEERSIQNATIIFAANLGSIFAELTDIAPTLGWNSIEEMYVGNFLGFAHACIFPLTNISEETLSSYAVKGLTWNRRTESEIKAINEEGS